MLEVYEKTGRMPLQIIKNVPKEEDCKQSSLKKSRSNKSRSKSKSKSKSRSYKKTNIDNSTILEGIKSQLGSFEEEETEGECMSPSVKINQDIFPNDDKFFHIMGNGNIGDLGKPNKAILYRYLKTKETLTKQANFRKLLNRKRFLEQKYKNEKNLKKLEPVESDLFTLTNTNKSRTTLKTTTCNTVDKIRINKERVSRLVENPYISTKDNFLTNQPKFAQIQRIETDPKKSRFLFSVSKSSLSNRSESRAKGLFETRSITPMTRLPHHDLNQKKAKITDVVLKHLKKRQARTVSKRRGRNPQNFGNLQNPQNTQNVRNLPNLKSLRKRKRSFNNTSNSYIRH